MRKAIVVGAGAGGCAAARELARDHEVTLVEAGGDFRPFAMRLSTFEPLRRAGLLFDERLISLFFSDMRVEKCPDMVMVYGQGMGGTTSLATGNALRYDGALRDLGIDLDREFALLEDLVPQTTEHRARWSESTRAAWDAFENLGMAPMITPKMITPQCVSCGHCVLGCRCGGKWTADRLLDDVEPAHLHVLSGTRVTRVMVDGNGRATGVACTGKSAPGTLEADLVVLAAGGMGTPRILQASGIACKPAFFGDPVLCVAAHVPGAGYDHELPMPFVAQRDGYILSPYFDYLSFLFNRSWRKPISDICSIMIKLADEENGTVTSHGFTKPLTARDHERLDRAVQDCHQILEALGVRRSDTFLGTVNAGHPGGAYPLTRDEAATLHHASLPAGLYLADATLLPQSMGNPPILTIMALAFAVAKAARAAA